MLKSGDLVWIKGSVAGKRRIAGTVVGRWAHQQEWWQVLVNGKIVHWPESQLEVINDR